MSKIVAIDIDGVTCDMHTELLRFYNTDYDDHLKVSDITMWEMHRFVKPECGTKIYDYFRLPNLYSNAKPIKGALATIRKLRLAGYRVIFPTDSAVGSWGNKYDWLIAHKFICTKKDYMEVSDKSLVRADYMVDDYWKNLEVFCGYGILFRRPWNWGHYQDERYAQTSSWDDVLKFFDL